MPIKRGDIVLVPFPFTDASGSKRRPALVVQNDRNNQRLNAVILALVTSNIQRAVTEPSQLFIDISTADGRQSGLLHHSAVKCEHLVTVHQGLIERVIGRLSASQMNAVNRCLQISLALP